MTIQNQGVIYLRSRNHLRCSYSQMELFNIHQTGDRENSPTHLLKKIRKLLRAFGNKQKHRRVEYRQPLIYDGLTYDFTMV